MSKFELENQSNTKENREKRFKRYNFCIFIVSLIFQGFCAFNGGFSRNWDEVGNYWEPVHYALYGHGFMTWEWNSRWAFRSAVPVRILQFFGIIFQNFGLNRSQVFYGLRLLVGIVGSFVTYRFSLSIFKKFSPFVGVLTHILCVFNFHHAYIMNRINMDAWGSLLLIMVHTSWFNDSIFGVLFYGFAAIVLRFNTLPIVGIIGLFILFSLPKRFNETKTYNWMNWVIKLGICAVLFLLFWVVIFIVADSQWYKRPTMAFWNSFIFNIVENQNSLFGTGDSSYYPNLLKQDNNIIVYFLTFASFFISGSRLQYFTPSVICYLYLNNMAQKQERFIWYIYPLLCMMTADVIAFILGNDEHNLVESVEITKDVDISNSDLSDLDNENAEIIDDEVFDEEVEVVEKKKSDKICLSKELHAILFAKFPQIKMKIDKPSRISYVTELRDFLMKSPLIRYVFIGLTIFVTIFYCWFGVASQIIQYDVYKPYVDYDREYVDTEDGFSTITDNKENLTCLIAGMPWISWHLPLACKNFHIVQIMDEFFPGYNTESFHMFEKPENSVNLQVTITDRLFIQSQNHWDLYSELLRIVKSSEKFEEKIQNDEDFKKEMEDIDLIFITANVPAKYYLAHDLEKIACLPYRDPKLPIYGYYFETLLKPLLYEEHIINSNKCAKPKMKPVIDLPVYDFYFGLDFLNRVKLTYKFGYDKLWDSHVSNVLSIWAKPLENEIVEEPLQCFINDTIFNKFLFNDSMSYRDWKIENQQNIMYELENWEKLSNLTYVAERMPCTRPDNKNLKNLQILFRQSEINTIKKFTDENNIDSELYSLLEKDLQGTMV
eukprot:TRINITY_DN3221_c0_g2_i1.p1 TRINITY_DN3221_c0_g2~~TRINITY_DN3221_c0_g2_i1.p1  ORF type:complete len:831 (+),score=202.63 TRINITY_DN3221_c0_g2_i1:63-2555(+)